MDGKTPSRETAKATRARSTSNAKSAEDWRAGALHLRPGFLIRRLHQIHVGHILEECEEEGVTPVQYSLLTALEQLGPLEQTQLSKVVALDRATVADVVRRLGQRGFVQRSVSRSDGRVKVVTLTKVGRALLSRLSTGARRAHDLTVDALPPAERQRFIDTLIRLVEAHNTRSRANGDARKLGSRSGAVAE